MKWIIKTGPKDQPFFVLLVFVYIRYYERMVFWGMVCDVFLCGDMIVCENWKCVLRSVYGIRMLLLNLRRQVLVHGLIVAEADVIRLLLLVSVTAQRVAHGVLGRWRHHRRCCAAGRWSAHRIGRCAGCLFGCVHVCLLLCLADVLLVANSLVAEPIADLRHLRTQQTRQMGRVELHKQHDPP